MRGKFNYLLVIEYNGIHFHGWQKQADVNSVQGELESAIRKSLHIDDDSDPRLLSSLSAAGRTDAGVHARAQVVTFYSDIDIPEHSFTHSVSSILKNKLSILRIQKVPHSFHPLLSATARQYQYVILNRAAPAVLNYERSWHVPQKLNFEKLCDDAQAIVGRHDFSSFRGKACMSKNPIKEVFVSSFERSDCELVYTIKGKGFLKQMVRNIVGTLVRLNHNKLRIKDIREVLAVKDRTKAGITAPASGLFLDYVEYDYWRSNECPLPESFSFFY